MAAAPARRGVPKPVVTCKSLNEILSTGWCRAELLVYDLLSLDADFGERHLLTNVVLKKLQTRLRSLQFSSLTSLAR